MAVRARYPNAPCLWETSRPVNQKHPEGITHKQPPRWAVRRKLLELAYAGGWTQRTYG